MLASFHKWGKQCVPASGSSGVNFIDCYLDTKGAISVQAKKNPYNNCYTSIPIRLSVKPYIEAIRKMTKFLSTTFAKSGQGHLMIMAMIALAVHHHPMPHVMIFLIGLGGEGNTFFTMKLLKAVFGTGHASPSSKMLQVEEECSQARASVCPSGLASIR